MSTFTPAKRYLAYSWARQRLIKRRDGKAGTNHYDENPLSLLRAWRADNSKFSVLRKSLSEDFPELELSGEDKESAMETKLNGLSMDAKIIFLTKCIEKTQS